MDWDKIHTIQDLLDPTSSDNSEQYDTKRTEANELPFPPLRCRGFGLLRGFLGWG